MFYHGTSSLLITGNYLLPADITGVLRENRQQNKDVVFLTRSKLSAARYAKKACALFGGSPIIATVMPSVVYERINGEVVCDYAFITKKEEI